VVAKEAGIRVFAAEPSNVDDCHRGFYSTTQERVTEAGIGQSVADGLLTFTGELTWPIIRGVVEDVFTVSEEEIVCAMKHVYERMKVVIEPSAAVGLAVALYNTKFKAVGNIKNLGIVLCGGNLDLDKPLPWCKAS
jgi:threonine dehydratase